MSLVRSLPVFISIFISTGLWLLGFSLVPAQEKPYTGERVVQTQRLSVQSSRARGGFAALVCSELVSDRELRERLENQGFTGLVSESGQWVLLDSFGNIEHIPLDEYDSRVLPFDPRNDGYAQKLRALFVQDGRRFIYIPIGFPASASLAKIEKRLSVALGDINYSFEYTGAGRPAGFFILLFLFAVSAFFVIPPLRLAMYPHAAILIPCLPLLAPLALGGAAGLALAGLLAGFSVLLASSTEQFNLLYRREMPQTLSRLLPFVLMICYGIIIIVAGLSLLFSLLVLASVCAVVIFLLKGAPALFREAGSPQAGEGRQRFSPVPILRRRSSAFTFAWAILPFAAAALVLAIVPAFRFGPALSPQDFPPLPSAAALTESDYHRHYLFQSRFSQSSLHTSGASAPESSGGINVYNLAPDGLLYFSLREDPLLSAIPPFPLRDLLRYR